MNGIIVYVILFGLLIIPNPEVFAQSETDSIPAEKQVTVEMKNGDEYRGTILSEDDEKIILRTVNGEISLIKSQLVSVESYDYKGTFDFENPHDTRYFFGPSAIPVKKNKGYYQNVLLTQNFVNYGITNNISIGGGLEFISTVLGYPIWFLNPKVGFSLQENIHVGGGFIMAGFAAQGTAALGYGVFTLGNSDSNMTLGLGYGTAGGDITDSPTIMLSGTHRVTNSVALLSENYLLPGGSYFGVHGLRILSQKNSFDFGGIVIPAIVDSIPVLPFIGYVRVF